MKSFKGYLHRWLASAAQVAPFVHDQIMDALRGSTQAAIQSCNAQDATCGFRWTTGNYDGDTGAGQQMNVLAALLTTLIDVDPSLAAGGGAAPVTNSTGGTSVGDSNAGSDAADRATTVLEPVTTRDRAVAGAVTGMVCLSTAVVMLWMSGNWFEGGLGSSSGGV